MKRNNIPIAEFNTNIFDDLNSKWMLLCSGDKRNFNFMTVSWGLMGTFFFKPIVMVGVRPQRHTKEFIENYDTFTLSAFPAKYKEELTFCGKNSGREFDKLQKTGFTVVDSEKIEAPSFSEAELIIEGKIIYTEELKGKNFKDKKIVPAVYSNRDFHKLFFAEVMNISGVSAYQK